jgi:pimeloyl-ACP methyl ester carboxylesterase
MTSLCLALTACVLFALAASAGGTSPSGGLAAVEAGTGSPAIVLIHSIGGDRGDWSRVAPLLVARHRVVLVDLPGHGASALTGKPTVRGAAAALSRTLADRHVERAILVGHSYGALVALQAAVDHPKRALAVVAVDAATYPPADSERIASAEQMLSERYSVFVQAVFSAMSNDARRGDTLAARAALVPHDVLTGYFRDAWREDLRPRIRSLKTPIHLVATEALWPNKESWTSARRRLGYESAGPAVGRRVPDSGHMVAIDQPDSLAAIIESVAASSR